MGSGNRNMLALLGTLLHKPWQLTNKMCGTSRSPELCFAVIVLTGKVVRRLGFYSTYTVFRIHRNYI